VINFSTDAEVRSVSLDELLQLWSMIEVRVLCRGNADLVDQAVPVLHRLRGAMGRYLAVGASDAAVVGTLCDFSPPCAYAVFHNDLPGPFRDGRLPKPFVPMLDRVGDDLMITYRLFGKAAHWAGEFRAAIVAAARMGLDRARMDPLVLTVEGTDIRDHALPPLPERWSLLSLSALTPLVQRSDAAPGRRGREKPSALDLQPVLTGLRFRAEGLGLWHGLRSQVDLPALQADAARLVQGAVFAPGQGRVPVRRGGEDAARSRQGWVGSVRLPAPGADLKALLWLAMVAHVGADTAIGAGRIGLTVKG
jgi:hypothetical protein